MRVLHVSWEYPPLVYGGLGRHVHALAEAEAAAGHEVVVLTQQPEDAPRNDVVNGVRVHRVETVPPAVPLDTDHLLTWVMGLEHSMVREGGRLLEEWAPEVVHGHDWLVAHAGTALADRAGVPLVSTTHATEAGRHQGWLPTDLSRSIHSVEWWLAHEATRTIVCSEHMRGEVVTLFDADPAQIDVIPNGIDLRRWTAPTGVAAARRRWQPDPDAPLVVFSGRLEWEKGVHTLLAAVPALRRRFPGLRVVVGGRGGQAEALAAQARESRLGRSVVFSGFLPEDDLTALVAAADVSVTPSVYEPFGLVALEAAALGTPVVVAATGGLAEFVRDGVTGRTFPPGDHRVLADVLTEVLRDPAGRRAQAAAARERLRDSHGWPLIATSTASVYEQATAEHLPRSARLALADVPARYEGNLLLRR